MKISKQMVLNVRKRLSLQGLSMGLNQSGCWLELQPVAMVERRIDSINTSKILEGSHCDNDPKQPGIFHGLPQNMQDQGFIMAGKSSQFFLLVFLKLWVVALTI